MNNRRILPAIVNVLLAAVLSAGFIFALTGCEKTETNKYNNGVNGMTIPKELAGCDENLDKVITERKFKKPKLKENSGTFTVTALFSDKMILQANMAGRFFGNYWGYEEDNYVALEIKNDETGKAQTFYGQCDKKGDFDIWFSPYDYGGPYTLTLYCEEGNSVEYKDVLFGEVYVLGGQSNMGWALGQCYDGTTEKLLYQDIIDESYNSDVRSCLVWPVSSKDNVDVLTSMRPWQYAEPDTVTSFSACGYFFARRLNELYNVPVGVISACMGGTPISAWFTTGEWYKGVVNPVKRLRVRGVCWYQGEGDYNKYGERLEALINEWRSEFENKDLYWAAVEMPRYQSDESWAHCRDEVRSLYGNVSNYTFCVTLDTGLYPEWKAEGDTLNSDGIHPYEKLKVGERLADSVAYDFYGAPGLWTSPYLVSTIREGDKIILTFDNVGEGLCLVGTNGFQVITSKGKHKDVTPALEGKDKIVLDVSGFDDVTDVWYGIRNYRGEGITSCADSVCVYNMKDGEAAYPAEQFFSAFGLWSDN